MENIAHILLQPCNINNTPMYWISLLSHCFLEEYVVHTDAPDLGNVSASQNTQVSVYL